MHYFEDGNLQMQTTKQVPDVNIEFSNESEFAEKVFQLVRAKESELQGGLEEMYSNMNNETFKSLRRVMGITKTKMDWNVNAVRMVKQVRK